MAKRPRWSILALTALLALSSSAARRESGTKQSLLASVGEVHDGVLTALGQDPRYEIKDGSDRIEAKLSLVDKPFTLVALVRKGESNDQTELEIVYEGQGSPEQKGAFESAFLQKVTEAIKYAETGYNRAPDLKSPLDVGPKADNTPRVPAVDDVRRY